MKDTGTGPSLERASAVFNAGAQLESVPTRTTFKAFGNQTITPIGTCKFTKVFENRTLTVPAYVFADDKVTMTSSLVIPSAIREVQT